MHLGTHAEMSVQGCSGQGCSLSGTHAQEGYGRWELFRQKGLDLYAAHRNNALKRFGILILTLSKALGHVSIA